MGKHFLYINFNFTAAVIKDVLLNVKIIFKYVESFLKISLNILKHLEYY